MNSVNKTEQYKKALSIIEHLSGADGYQLDGVGKMATVAAILKMHFPEWIFVGFYRVTGEDTLVIGPYQGAILACGTIRIGRGVCGQCALQRKTLIVPDVSQFPGYIACDDATVSEIAVPVIKADRLVAVLDVDSGLRGAFDSADQHFLEKIVHFV